MKLISGFGIRVYGRVIKTGYLSAEIAEWYAKGLVAKGCASVEVIDLATGRCVKQLIPEAVPRAGP